MTYTLAIIPCTGQKHPDLKTARADEIWIGPHFQLTLAYAEMFFDRIMIMSFKYGLITPETVIDTYDIDMKDQPIRERIRWWYLLKEQINKLGAEDPPELVGLFTGLFERERVMREFVKSGVDQIVVPWEGLGIGQRQAAVYDAEPPFDREKLKRGEYKMRIVDATQTTTTETTGTAVGGKYQPPPTKLEGDIEWE